MRLLSNDVMADDDGYVRDILSWISISFYMLEKYKDRTMLCFIILKHFYANQK